DGIRDRNVTGVQTCALPIFRRRFPVKEIIIPELAESIEEGTISEWLVKPGDKVEKGDPVIDLETDKVNVEVQTDYTGVITEIVVEEGEEEPKGEEKAEAKPADEAGKQDDVIASPAARKRARELNIDLSEVSPRDPLGRV